MKPNNNSNSRSKLKDIGRWYVTRFVRHVAQTLAPHSRLLDAGAGECAYKQMFVAHRYVSVDAAIGDASWNYLNLDCIGMLDRLPFKDQCFDAVLCTQTLEHLEWPRESVREFHRVLKRGGRLYLTAPMAHKEHQRPHDFFRFTSFGLQSICRHAGFNQITVEPFGGVFVRWAYDLPNSLSVFWPSRSKTGHSQAKGPFWRPVKLLALAIIRLPQLILVALDRFDVVKDHPFGWSVIAQK
jgi:SAM-dependent methyltransferase